LKLSPKRRVTLASAALALVGGLLPGTLSNASAGPVVPLAGGFTSSNVEFVGNVPFEVGTATGASIFKRDGKDYMVVTSWKSFSIYDLTDPLAPTLVGTPVPFGFKFENEDVATNGRIMIFSEELPGDVLHVWDIQSLENPREIATVDGLGGHTASCILDCKYVISSDGHIIDLRRPDQPKEIGDWRTDKPGKSPHDVSEVAPGLVLTSTRPVMLLDFNKNPAKPKLLALGDEEKFVHSNKWPRNATDRWALVGGETVLGGGAQVCSEKSATFNVVDTKNWKKTKKFKTVDKFAYKNGAFVDGNPPVGAFGCTPHWFEAHPTWKDGGVLALGGYEAGTKFLTVAKKTGKIKEVGWFVPAAGATSAAYWRTNEIVYNIDYQRGIDILRYTGPLG
jgi:hypothetical protein